MKPFNQQLMELVEQYHIYDEYQADLLLEKGINRMNEMIHSRYLGRSLYLYGEEAIVRILSRLIHYEHHIIETIEEVQDKKNAVIISEADALEIFDKSCINNDTYEKYLRHQSYHEINENIINWKSEVDTEQKRVLLQKIIANCVMIKDFYSCSQYITIYEENGYKDSNNYTGFWSSTTRLLDVMSEVCKKREQKDIVVNWIDALRFDELREMNFLGKEAENSLFFENAFTVLPNTSHTFRTLFRGGLPIDDCQFNELVSNNKNSWLMKFLEEKGYYIRYYGDSNNKYLAPQYIYENVIKNSNITSMNYFWKMTDEILQSEKPVFAILHCLWETHQPYMYPEMERDEKAANYNSKTAENYLRIQKARTYLDKQLSFFKQFHSKNAVQIYLSDHGKLDDSFRDAVCHTVFFMKADFLPQKRITDLFSYQNFGILVKNLLEDKNVTEDILSEYIHIQTYATYEKKHILYGLKRNVISLGFRAIRSEYDKFIKNYDSSECYYRLPDENYNQIDNMVYQHRIEKMREENGSFFIDYSQYPFFQEAYKVQLFLASIRSREELRIRENEVIIRDAFWNIGTHRRVAFKGGGRHTIELLKLFERKEQIVCVCDTNRDNVSVEIPYPVCSIDELGKMKIDLIILSSFKFHRLFKAELMEKYPNLDTLDIYDILEKKNYSLNRAFYEYNFEEKDYMSLFE